jgi:hypothetical protein
MSYNEETDEFEATDSFESPLSSLVDEVAYDSESHELLVSLHSDSYLYKGVPVSVYRDFAKAWSKGGFYNRVIKKEYGRGESVGWDAEVVEKTTPAPDMGSVTTSGTPFNVTTSGAGFSGITFPLTIPEKEEEAPEQEKYTHRVDFTVEDGSDVKPYNVEAADVYEAKEIVEELGKALGIEFHVKGVYRTFE